MGEPLANYRNVLKAIDRIKNDLGIGARKITISTVGLVPNIRKLMTDMPQVRLAVSLHCATEEERSRLLPANRRYGGLDSLMPTLREYIEETHRRITLEWALIEGQNDTPETARALGGLIRRYGLRRDMVHVNVIPLNPTGGFAGSPSGRRRVQEFVRILDDEFGIACTPRVRRGIDIDAGCGQLKASIQKKEEEEKAFLSSLSVSKELASFVPPQAPVVGVYEDDDNEDNDETTVDDSVGFRVSEDAMDMDDDFEDVDWTGNTAELTEAQRLIALVQSTAKKNLADSRRDSSNNNNNNNNNALLETPATATTTTTMSTCTAPKTTTITSEDAVRQAKRRRKKLLKNLRAIDRLRQLQATGRILNDEQLVKVEREDEWKAELESVEHNLQ